MAGAGCLGSIADTNGECLVSTVQPQQTPLQHSPGRARKFKAPLREAARLLVPAKRTSAAEEGHLQGLLGSERCRQLAVDWTVESQEMHPEFPPCRAGPGLISSGSVLWPNRSQTCVSPGSRLHTYAPTGTGHGNIIKGQLPLAAKPSSSWFTEK